MDLLKTAGSAPAGTMVNEEGCPVERQRDAGGHLIPADAVKPSFDAEPKKPG